MYGTNRHTDANSAYSTLEQRDEHQKCRAFNCAADGAIEKDGRASARNYHHSQDARRAVREDAFPDRPSTVGRFLA